MRKIKNLCTMKLTYLHHLFRRKFFEVACTNGPEAGLVEWGFLEPFYPSPCPYVPHLSICFRVFGTYLIRFISKKDVHLLSATPIGGFFRNNESGMEYTIITYKQFLSDTSIPYCIIEDNNPGWNFDMFDLCFDLDNPRVIRTW